MNYCRGQWACSRRNGTKGLFDLERRRPGHSSRLQMSAYAKHKTRHSRQRFCFCSSQRGEGPKVKGQRSGIGKHTKWIRAAAPACGETGLFCSGAAGGSVCTTDVSHHAPVLRGAHQPVFNTSPEREREMLRARIYEGKTWQRFNCMGHSRQTGLSFVSICLFLLMKYWFRGCCVTISQCPRQTAGDGRVKSFLLT